MPEFSSKGKKHLLGMEVSASACQREFELDDVYPYIKTGIASIIEDEVTQRFVAEELKVLLIILPVQIFHCIQTRY